MIHARALSAALLGLVLMFAAAAQQPVNGVVGWYNGAWQSGLPGVFNWYKSPKKFCRAYDVFEVPAGGWTVIGVFSDNALFGSNKVNRASWEIRRDMTPGNGGTLVASGISPAMLKPDPSVSPSVYPAREVKKHFRIEIDGLRVSLPEGHYWLSVAPVVSGSTYLDATLGANAIGVPGGEPATALYSGAGLAEYAPADATGRGGQFGVARHFSQGVLITQ
jgi:hypothetical protein